MNTFREVIHDSRALYCLDCGKCSSVCPVTLHLVEGYTSPRLLVETALACGADTTLDDPLLWSCLTCRRCSEICPSEVDFSSFIQHMRQLASNQGNEGPCTHGGVVQSWMRMMSSADWRGERLDWIGPNLEIDEDSETIYFPGCLAFFDSAFRDLGIEGLDIARSAVRILNALGIQPRVLEDERCCGHDLYWQGEMETFRNLASQNLEAIHRSGAKRILTTCPECAYTLKHTYAEEVGDPGVEVFHLAQFLAEQGSLPRLVEEPPAGRSAVTYQDPCRLGRYEDVYQQPRDLLEEFGFDLIEMEHNRQESICCGTSCWTSCGQVNKRIQVDRLHEARTTNADLLVTACPKCQIHLKCAQNDPVTREEIAIPIRDLTTLLAEKLQQ